MTATVLIIDDSEDDQRLYRRALKDCDCSLEMFLTAEAGLARVADSSPHMKHPDLILLDYNLPDMDGLGFMKKLAGYSDTAIPIVMLTGEGSVEMAVEVMKHGADDYLAKDTAGQYLRLLPGVIKRSLTSLRERELSRRLRNETEMLLLRNRALMLASADGIHVMDIQGNLVEANDAFCRMLGYTQAEAVGLNVADWNAQWSVDELREKFKSLVGKSTRFETLHRRKDGTLLNVEVSSSGVEIEGQCLFFASSRDITERKKNEAVLRRYKQVIDTSIDGFWETDIRGNVLEANAAYAKMSGYTVEELEHMHISQLEAIEQKPEDVQAHIAKIMARGSDRFETRHRHKNGREIDMEISVTYMDDPQRLIVFCRDISARKLASLELQHNQYLLNEAQRLGKLGSWELDLPSGKLHWSDEMYRIFERDSALFTPSYENFLNVIHPDDRDRVNQAYTQSLQDFQPYDVKHRLLLADGRIKWVHEHCTSTFDASGKPLRSVGMSQDITDQKEGEAALQKSTANLRAILDNSPYLAWLKDTEGRYIMINKVFADYLQLEDVRQATGKTDLDLQPKALAEKYRADDAEVMAARQRKHVEESSFDGKNIHWVETFKTPIIDAHGNVLGTVGFASDITARKQADEAKLRERDLRFRGTLEQVGVGIIHVSLDGHFKQINQKFCEIIGYAREELMHKSFQDIIFPDDLDESIHYILELLADEIPSFSMEKRYVRKDRSLVWVNLTVSLLRDADGTPTYTIGVIEDITERKQAERRLTESEEKLRSLFAVLPIGVSILDKQQAIQEFNPALGEILGLTVPGLLENAYQKRKYLHADGTLFSPDEFPSYRALKEQNIIPPVEIAVVKEDNSIIWTEVTAAPLHYPEMACVVITTDITERKQNELKRQQLSDQISRYAEEVSDLYEHAPCGYHSIDKDGLFLRINVTELKWLGYTRDELVGKRRLPDLMSHASLANFHLTFPQFKKTGEIRDLEVDLIRKDGTLLPVLISATALYDADGNYIASRSTVYDMTERKKMEQERIDYLSRLEAVSHNLVATQEDMRRRLSSELHDRTSPNLAAIEINLNILSKNLPQDNLTGLAESLEDTRALIADTAASIREICSDMRPPLLDYAGLTAAVESYAQQFARRTGIAVQFDCDNCEARYTPEFESLLFRIFQEALTNCAKHAHATAVSVMLSVGSPVIMTIADDGIGFDPVQLGRSGQVGLGLLNMREMAEIAGGTLTIESTEGKGTRIAVEVAQYPCQ